MKKLILTTMGLALLAGCTTVEFVRRDLTPQKKAILRYTPQTSDKGEGEHKAKLDTQAREFCKGGYKIDKEYEALEETPSSGVRTGIGTGFGMGGGAVFVGGSNSRPSMYHFVELTCTAP